ncbi:MAG: VIT1/CCC1 family protein [Rikenellaceae bacterium]
MDQKIKKLVLTTQQAEETEHLIYMRLSKQSNDKNNAEVLQKIGQQEKGHAKFWQNKSGEEVKPDMWHVSCTVWLARLLGLSFVLKLMEKREGTGSRLYDQLAEYFPEAKAFSEEELIHEKELLAMLDEEGLQFVGSIVLGLNDALVELTGALAGFTLAMSDNKVISLVGLVTGISAALSMAALLITVVLLILPFLLLASKFVALAITLLTAVLIIFLFNYYISIAKDLNFKTRFLEMTFISLEWLLSRS